MPAADKCANQRSGQSLTTANRAAQDTLEERFRPDAEPKHDMIAQFIKPGATKEEATSEALVQV